MEVILAGHNIDYEIIREVAAAHPERKDLTPETVAAAYARISRNPRPVNELRMLARGEVEKARASNRNIVFEMGHSSIAEHAVFNLDFLAVSRLLVEEIEKFRLASYTEKSQRYVLLQDDFVIPAEVRRAGLEEAFVETVRAQNRCYHELFEKLRPFVFETHPELAADPANRSLLEGWAKEDARYVIALATETQLGMTVNARSTELMIRRLAASPSGRGRGVQPAALRGHAGGRPVARPLHGTDGLRPRDRRGAPGASRGDHRKNAGTAPQGGADCRRPPDRRDTGGPTKRSSRRSSTAPRTSRSRTAGRSPHAWTAGSRRRSSRPRSSI